MEVANKIEEAARIWAQVNGKRPTRLIISEKKYNELLSLLVGEITVLEQFNGMLVIKDPYMKDGYQFS